VGEREKDWRTVLLAAASLGGALLAFVVATLLVAYALAGLVRGELRQSGPPPLQALVLASALSLVGVTLLPSAYYSIERLRGADIPLAKPSSMKVWQGILLLLLWIGASLLAQLLVDQNIWKWFTPPLYLLAIGIPVYFLIRMATGGLNAGSRQRFWGVLAVSMVLGTTLAIIAEAALALIGLLGLGLYLGFHPEQVAAFSQIANQLTNSSSLEQVLNVIGPWLNSPFVVGLALLFFSGFAPFIEETAKSIAAWTVYDRLASPAQGFVVGALGGAGFGLLESLLAGATPDSSWASTLMVRGASTMMHIMAAALTGWGIASFRARKGARVLVGSYVLAMALHGLWNASVVMIAFGGLRTEFSFNTSDPAGSMMMALGGFALFMLCLAIPLVLGIINWKLRTSAAIAPPAQGSPLSAPIEVEERATTRDVGPGVK
jgi:RsiW-degrading membrane proteinase PrsW (M82 family)